MLSVTLIGLTITRIVRTESVYPWGFYGMDPCYISKATKCLILA